MPLTDADAPPFSDASEYNAIYAKYFVPKSGLHDNITKANHVLGPLQYLTSQKCAYSASPGECAAIESKTTCNTVPGCKWLPTATSPDPKCQPSSDCKCTVMTSQALSKCASYRKWNACTSRSECHWDAELGLCESNPNLWHIALGCAALVPVVYLACYVMFNRSDIQKVWAPYGSSLRVLHGSSMIVATLGCVFLLLTIALTRKHLDNRRWFADSLFLIAAGAAMVPVFRALFLVRGWSPYWVLLALVATSAGTMWFVGEYIHRNQDAPDVVYQRRNPHHSGKLSLFIRTAPGTPDNTLNLIGALSAYYLLFHVLVVDNLGWWLLFVSR